MRTVTFNLSLSISQHFTPVSVSGKPDGCAAWAGSACIKARAYRAKKRSLASGKVVASI